MTLVFADKGKQLGATLFTPCPKWEAFRLDNAKIIWQPGVFGGDGTENRVNICFQSSEGEDKIHEYEKCLFGKVCSCVKGDDGFRHIKAKMAWDKVRFYDANSNKLLKPPNLAGYVCNVMFAIKGKWQASGQMGLSLEVTNIQLLCAADDDLGKCPFDDDPDHEANRIHEEDKMSRWFPDRY